MILMKKKAVLNTNLHLKQINAFLKEENAYKKKKRCINFNYDVTDKTGETNKKNCEAITSIEENNGGQKFFGKCTYNPRAFHKCDFGD